jgi:hypothetical protein
MQKKDDENIFSRLPQRHLSEAEKQYIAVLIEKSQLNRERAKLILDKGLMLFFAFLLFAIIAYENDWISKILFNLVVMASVCVLMLAVTPYLNISKKEEEKLDRVLKELLGE